MNNDHGVLIERIGPNADIDEVATHDNHVQNESNPGRNLVVCIDGTSNKFSQKSTNVVELFGHVEKNDAQLTYYNSGVGTYARPSWRGLSEVKKIIGKGLDLVVAWSFERDIMAAYDSFHQVLTALRSGFSRGAYQVRVLAAMIHSVGLIYPGNKQQIPFAWEVYASSDRGMDTFKRTFSRREVDLHFLGVWDTVSAVGLRLGALLPSTNASAEYITHTRQALALDERRARFLPEYIVGEHKQGGTKKEVWFAGTHSDIGGGNKANPNLDLGAEPLKWMMDEARSVGLVATLHEKTTGIPEADVTESLRHLWWTCEYLPISRRVYLTDGRSDTFRWRLHRGRGRKVLPGQYIHWTVWTGLRFQDCDSTDENWRCESEAIENNERTSHNAPKRTWGNALGHLMLRRQEGESGYKPKALIKQGGNSKDEWAKLAAKIKTLSTESDSRDFLPRGPIGWEGGRSLLEAVGLVVRRTNASRNELETWQQNLFDYTAGGQGKPELIWHYGGPKLLHDLVSIADTQRTKAIIQSTLGINIVEINSPGQETLQPILGNWKAVNTRVFLLLRQWAAPDPTPAPPAQRRFFQPDKPVPSGTITPSTILEDVFLGAWTVSSKVIDRSHLLSAIVSVKSTTLFESIVFVESLDEVISRQTDRKVNDSNARIDLAEKALSVIVKLNINGRLIAQHSWDEFISYAMGHLEGNKVSKSLVVPTVKVLASLAHDVECARLIFSQPQFDRLLVRLGQDRNNTGTPSDGFHIELIHLIVSTINDLIEMEGLDQASGNLSNTLNTSIKHIVDRLVDVMEHPEDPSLPQVLGVIDYACKQKLLDTPASEDFAHSTLGRVILCSLNLAGESQAAMKILVTLTSTGQFFMETTMNVEIQSKIGELVGGRSVEVSIMACTLVERLIEHRALADSLRQGVSPNLVLFLKSPRLGLQEAALGVIKAMALHSMEINEQVVQELKIHASKAGGDRNISISILWVISLRQSNLRLPEDLPIPSFDAMLKGHDARLAWNAMHALSQQVTQND
ncbi:WD40 repeat protein [Ceratobasidium sp. AG-Ba]|nr:WD40 repeat protein [Ceratobasidium sp. AG-Ba]